MEYAQLSMNEILCHGLRANFLFEQDCTVIDVGGQDMKAIRSQISPSVTLKFHVR